MQMTLILNICEKLALTLGTIGLIGFIVCLILAIELSVKNKSIEPLCSVFPQQPWYLSFMYISIGFLFLIKY
jgi:hypothetical protein